MKQLVLLVAFLLELCAFVAIGYAGFNYDLPLVFRVLLGLGGPALVIFYWSRYMSPRAPKRLAKQPYRIVKLLIFILAAAMLASVGQVMIATIFMAIIIADELLLAVFFKGRTE